MKQTQNIESKAPRVLIFPKQRASGCTQSAINYMQNQQQQFAANKLSNSRTILPPDFFVSLTTIEPKPLNLNNPSIELIKTLVESYQLIIEQLQSDKQDGLTLYFQNKLNNILEQSAVKLTIKQSNEKELIKMIEQLDSTKRNQSNDEAELLLLQQQFRRDKSNSLVNYINVQERLELEQLKVKKIMQEYDQVSEQYEEIRQKDLDIQQANLENRLKQRGQHKHSSQHHN